MTVKTRYYNLGDAKFVDIFEGKARADHAMMVESLVGDQVIFHNSHGEGAMSFQFMERDLSRVGELHAVYFIIWRFCMQ